MDAACRSVVMVRVRGSDCQGWKTTHASFFSAENGITALASSGVILPPAVCAHISRLNKQPNASSTSSVSSSEPAAYVLCTANHIVPFLAEAGLPLSAPKLQPGTEVDVLVEVPSVAERNYEVSYTEQGPSTWLPCEIVRIGTIETVEDAIRSLTIGSGGWVVGPRTARTHPSSPPSRISAGLVALLKITCSSSLPLFSQSSHSLFWSSSSVLTRGTEVTIACSPFGLLSPAIFHNSLSKGILSNFVGSKLFYPPALTSGSKNHSTTSASSSTWSSCSFPWSLFASSLSSLSAPSASTSYPAVMTTDARCLPGSEGGAVLVNGQFVGMLALPLRHTSSSIEVNLVISSDALYLWLCEQPLSQRSRDENVSLPSLPSLNVPVASAASVHSSAISVIDRSLLIARVGSSWASAVILSASGYILTNAHLLRPYLAAPSSSSTTPSSSDLPSSSSASKLPDFFSSAFSVKATSNEGLDPFNVKLKYNESVMVRLQSHHFSSSSSPSSSSSSSSSVSLNCDRWVKCRVVYVCTGAWDVCLLKVDVEGALFSAQLCLDDPKRGQTVFVAGHALFGPPADLMPTITRGVLSRVAYLPTVSDSKVFTPVLLQTDAAVHNGNSGGILSDERGLLLGLVTSNVKHTWQPLLLSDPLDPVTTTQHPLLNFSIPSIQLQPLAHFANTENVDILKNFNRPNERVLQLWSLEEIAPRPAPVLREGEKYREIVRKVSEEAKKSISKL